MDNKIRDKEITRHFTAHITGPDADKIDFIEFLDNSSLNCEVTSMNDNTYYTPKKDKR